MSDKVTVSDGKITLHLKSIAELRGPGPRKIADIVAENRNVQIWGQDRKWMLSSPKGRRQWRKYYRAWKRAKRPVPWSEYLNARHFYDTYGPM